MRLIKEMKLIKLKTLLTPCALFSALFLITGCVASHVDEVQYQAAHQQIDKPNFLIPPAQNNYRLMSGNNPVVVKAFNQYVKTGKAPNIMTEGFIQYAYNQGQQPVISTTPYQQTVISLQPGERFTNVSTADPQRWSYSVAYSGTGADKRVNVLVTPAVPNISTNMVITTDRRLYDLKLVSTLDNHYIRDVRFWYPEDMVNAWNDIAEQQANGVDVAAVPNIDLNHLNFDYAISSSGWHGTRWKPTRIFDDGKQTFIQMPSSISSGDLPTLFVMNGQNQELVNYRYKAPYFVVDKIFQQAALLSGVGSNQKQVLITNRRY